MDISKTAFKEYTRCPRIFPLEQLYLFRLNSDIRLFDDEEKTEAREILRLMFDEETGQANTQHSTLPVPFIFCSSRKGTIIPGGSLADVAPTMLALMGIPQPAEMTGKNLID